MKNLVLKPAVATIVLLSVAAAGIIIGGIALILTTVQYNVAQDRANQLDAAASAPDASDSAWQRYYVAADKASAAHRTQDVAAAAVDAGFFAGLGYLGVSALGRSALGRRRDEPGGLAQGGSVQRGPVQPPYQQGAPGWPQQPYNAGAQRPVQYPGQYQGGPGQQPFQQGPSQQASGQPGNWPPQPPAPSQGPAEGQNQPQPSAGRQPPENPPQQ